LSENIFVLELRSALGYQSVGVSMWTAAVMPAPGMTIVIQVDGACDTADATATSAPSRETYHAAARARAL
jgi:hypothetical protein